MSDAYYCKECTIEEKDVSSKYLASVCVCVCVFLVSVCGVCVCFICLKRKIIFKLSTAV